MNSLSTSQANPLDITPRSADWQSAVSPTGSRLAVPSANDSQTRQMVGPGGLHRFSVGVPSGPSSKHRHNEQAADCNYANKSPSPSPLNEERVGVRSEQTKRIQNAQNKSLDVGCWTYWPAGATGVRCFLLLFLFTLSASAQDWPQILGPNRDGIYTGPALAQTWPKEGPKVLWQKNIGSGFAGPAARDGKVILFHRVNNDEVIDCFNATNGTPVWQFKYPTTYVDGFGFDNGPRAVPTIAGDTVVTFGADGMLTAVKFKDGSKLWQVNTRKEFGADKGFFGLACSPLVEGSLVIVNIGGENGAGIVAFELTTGKVKWKSNNNEASYSSPAAATINGQRLVFVFHRAGLAGLTPADGKTIFEYPWRSRENASVNGATPLIIGKRIFVSASYDTGASLLELINDKPKVIWANDESLSNQYATSVHAKGYLYGLHGRHDFPGGTELRCIELATGNVKWSERDLSPANVLLAGDQLLVLTERGELLSVAASPDGYKLNNRAQILGTKVRDYPALANGIFYARDTKKLIAVDLR